MMRGLCCGAGRMDALALAAAVCLAVVSCAGGPPKTGVDEGARGAAFLQALNVGGKPAALSEPERIALESAALRVVATGADAVGAILADLENNRDANRRDVLVRLLNAILDRMPANAPERAGVDKQIADASKQFMASREPSDRYLGARLAALPSRSMLVPAAVALLSDEHPANREFAAFILRQVAQADLGYDPAAPEAQRKAAAKRWKSWWQKNKGNTFYYSHTPMANPLKQALTAEMANIARSAGPYPLEVRDNTGQAVPEAVVAYSYYFTTYDGRGERKSERTVTDAGGKLLLGAQAAAPGMRFVGAEIIVSKAGYKQEAVRLLPHLITQNSYMVKITVSKE